MRYDHTAVFAKLATSAFRSRFRLGGRDLAYARQRGAAVLADHARTMLGTRLFTATPARDGKQTPFRGHPVFVAQHATGTCCRGCLSKWHGIAKGHALTRDEEDYVLDVIMTWIKGQIDVDAP